MPNDFLRLFKTCKAGVDLNTELKKGISVKWKLFNIQVFQVIIS